MASLTTHLPTKNLGSLRNRLLSPLQEELAPVEQVVNRAVVLPPLNPLGPTPVVVADLASVDEAWMSAVNAGVPSIIVVDNVLSPEALEAAYRACMLSTIWFDSTKPNDYVGAYLQWGLMDPNILRLAKELREGMPQALGPHRLSSLWSYKYGSGPSTSEQDGIPVHADFAAVNMNLWLTPDEANLDPEKGGLIIFHRRPEAHVTFEKFNCPTNDEVCHERVNAFVRDSPNTTVPYRANRMVIFDSSLLHKTDDYRFKGGYKNRRINLTLLWGMGTWVKRDEGQHRGGASSREGRYT